MFTTLDENRLLHQFYRDLSDFLAENMAKDLSRKDFVYTRVVQESRRLFK